MKKREFGDLELAVLGVLKSGERMTVKEVHRLLGGKDKYTTIMTVMFRLANKKALARERVGSHYEYWQIPKNSSFFEKIKKKLFGVKPRELIACLIDSGNEISDEELLEMEKMLAAAREKRKE